MCALLPLWLSVFPRPPPSLLPNPLIADVIVGDVCSAASLAAVSLTPSVCITPSFADVIVGDVCSAASLAATGVANKYQIPMVSPASTSTSLSNVNDYFFRYALMFIK